MSKLLLQSRWKENLQAKKSFETIILSLVKGAVIIHNLSPFELLEKNILDFRGLFLDGIKIKKAIVEYADFSFSSFKTTWIENSVFNKCIFNNVNFSNFSDHGNRFIDCNFLSCKFIHSSIGYEGSNFSKCTFDNCNFQKSIFIRTEFIGTKFINCKIKNLDFNASFFEDCDFEGLIENVWFRGNFPLTSDIKEFGQPKRNEMLNVSFEKAELRDVTFSDSCNLSTIRLKNDNSHLRYGKWNKRLQKLASEVFSWENKEEKKEAEIFVNTYLVHANNQDWNIINIYDLERDYGRKVALRIIEGLNSF